jgi:diacylglycerol kinase (ATP)
MERAESPSQRVAGDVVDGALPAAPRPGRRIRVLWNAAAGSKGGIPTNRGSEEDVHELMARHGLGDDLVPTQSEEEARAAARSAIEDGYDLVVAAGGDGTIGLVAEELIGSRVALGMLPLGSVMNIPRMLGLPRDLDEAGSVLETGDVRLVDVGEVAGRPFFEAGSVGMNAAMFREVQRFDDGDWLSILRSVWVAVRYRPARMTIHLDDRLVRTRSLVVTVSNGPFTGAGMTIAPEARLDDGRFDVRIFRRFSKWELLRHLASIAFGRRRYTPQIDTYRSRRVRVESSRPLPCRADARDLGTTPVEFVTRPASLRVVVPRGGGPAGAPTAPAPELPTHVAGEPLVRPPKPRA